MKFVASFLSLIFAIPAMACDIDYGVNLKTLGQTVIVELRSGKPGRSKVVETKRSSGGKVGFFGLCPGEYFLAIGDDNYVDVTPIRTFQDGYSYESEITLQRGAGNVNKKKRSAL